MYLLNEKSSETGQKPRLLDRPLGFGPTNQNISYVSLHRFVESYHLFPIYPLGSLT